MFTIILKRTRDICVRCQGGSRSKIVAFMINNSFQFCITGGTNHHGRSSDLCKGNKRSSRIFVSEIIFSGIGENIKS